MPTDDMRMFFGRRRKALKSIAFVCGPVAMTWTAAALAAQPEITFESLQQQVTEQAERVAVLEAQTRRVS